MTRAGPPPSRTPGSDRRKCAAVGEPRQGKPLIAATVSSSSIPPSVKYIAKPSGAECLN